MSDMEGNVSAQEIILCQGRTFVARVQISPVKAVGFEI